ncbi:MBL fold metallo-hydrolase [Brevundimonas sp. LM2]|uniref:MBL fold metallo-hydrolase n=1 Tax=Brevundimonas sp. LM2 TaxID=1938605 RepID=UPI00209AA5BE|nr:MBL fold metallo-hydrolase [Brevundimonas sp. LM2]
MTRRHAIQALGVGMLVSSLAGRGAAQPGLSIQAVESLSIQVVVDAAVFGPFLPDRDQPGLRIERNPQAGPPAARMSRQSLMAEFGLSLLAQSRLDDETRRVLVDFGYSSEVLANNLRMLGIDAATLDASVLSHGHLDHYGGFAALRSDPATRLPLYVGGEETFCERVAMIGAPPPVMGALDRADLASAGFEVRMAADPVRVAGHAFTTGTIPLQTFERAAIPTRMRPGVGCAAADLSVDKRDLAELADDGAHELATCYAVRDLGLVVIASCSHRGVLNSVLRARAVSGIDKVHAVVGGFHLVRPRTEDEARRTVAEFAAIDPTWIIPMHCTGEVFIAEALRVMPDKVVRPYVGNRFTFASA